MKERIRKAKNELFGISSSDAPTWDAEQTATQARCESIADSGPEIFCNGSKR